MNCELFIILGKGQYCRIICNVDIRVPIRVGRNIIDVSPLVLIEGEVHLCLHIQNGSISIFCQILQLCNQIGRNWNVDGLKCKPPSGVRDAFSKALLPLFK